MAAEAVGDGQCHTCLVIYPTGNLEGRYRRGGENADDYARGACQWPAPWGNHGGNDFINIFSHGQYCLKYGGQHRNGLLTSSQTATIQTVTRLNASHKTNPTTE